MAVPFAVITLLLVFVASVLIIRTGTIALVMTGMSEEMASFQAASAFSGAGFTTGEAEQAILTPINVGRQAAGRGQPTATVTVHRKGWRGEARRARPSAPRPRSAEPAWSEGLPLDHAAGPQEARHAGRHRDVRKPANRVSRSVRAVQWLHAVAIQQNTHRQSENREADKRTKHALGKRNNGREMNSGSQDTEAPSTRDEEQDESVDFSDYNLPTDLTAFQLHTLHVINHLSPTEGVEIQDALEQLYPEAINHGRLYPGLDRLAEKGLITKQTKESDNRRNEYAITGRGDWAAEEYSQFIQAMVK